MSSGADNNRWFLPAGSATGGTSGGVSGGASVDLVVDDTVEGWEHTGLVVVTLEGDGGLAYPLDGYEAMIVPLNGGCSVVVDDEDFDLTGRSSVFAGPTDVLYVPPRANLEITAAEGRARIAICLAKVAGDTESPSQTASPATATSATSTSATPTSGNSNSVTSTPVTHLPATYLPATYLPASDVPVELRGGGIASRQVRNFGVPDVLDAHRMIACEIITPAGNWSSWPPHKHDEERPGVESELEEIYYFETQSTRVGSDSSEVDPVGYQRVYGTADRPIDVLAEVRTGDVVLVPHGWHGPAMAAPNADLYYLNVMAGPGPERAWLICDDPAHGWVRDEWAAEGIDPRLTSTPTNKPSAQDSPSLTED